MKDRQVIIIAEAGVNHNGDYGLAEKMVYEAKRIGADYVKFQTAVPEQVISRFAPKAEYQKETTGEDESQLEMCRKIHLPLEAYPRLKQLCDEVGIGFMSTPFDLDSIDCLARLDMDFWKIPSGEITNLPYLRKIGAMGKKVIMSTGMATLDEVEAAVEVLKESGTEVNNIFLLHCTTQYPAPIESVNLLAMTELSKIGCGGVGYSDHTEGILIAPVAVGMGAKVIEKHFTISRELPGPDHRASLEPDEFGRMIENIRLVEKSLGSVIKTVAEAEKCNITVARKSIVAGCDIKKGEIFSEKNLAVKRPGNGINPMLWDEIIGKEAKRDFAADELIEL